MLRDIRNVSQDHLIDFFKESGEKSFRAKQVWEWIWAKSATSIDDMTNLSKPLRELLKEHFEFRPVTVHHHQISSDGTIKSAFKLNDNTLIEGVLIPADDRMTACVSSQVGCSLSCTFCATGYMERTRNLEPAEIYDQVVAIDRQARDNYDRPLTNIVFMGMGEPLLNYKNVMMGIDRITAEDGLNMSPRRITLSTAGIAKMIRTMADDGAKFKLALSLHAANDEKRNRIMAINETNSLAALKEALLYFYEKTKNWITLEYIVFQNFNDTLEDAKELWQFARQIPSKINIIEYNPIMEAKFQNADADRIDEFAAYLRKKDLVVNVRKSRGKDIDAACGQLANKG